MKKILLLTLPFLLLLSCNPLDLSTLDQDIKFEELDLKVSYELEDLRFDVIRQQTSDATSDVGDTDTEDVPYHPFGFDLGNGLFYDLNGNLGLNIKQLMSIRDDEEYELTETRRTRRERTHLKAENEICDIWAALGKDDWTICQEIDQIGDTLTVTRNGNFCYRITETADAVEFTRTKRNIIRTRIAKVAEQEFTVNRSLVKRTFRQTGERIDLNRRYRIERKEEGAVIEIYSTALGSNRLLFTLAKDANNLYLYNRRDRGYKIELGEEKLIIYRNENENPLYEFERVK